MEQNIYIVTGGQSHCHNYCRLMDAKLFMKNIIVRIIIDNKIRIEK